MNKVIKEDLTVQEAFEKYQRYNELRNLSIHTLEHKEVNHKRFMQYLDNDNFLIKDIKKKIIDDYTFYLKKDGLKAVSINTNLRSIRAFINWAADNDYLEPFKITNLKQEEIIKETYSEAQLEKLLKKPNIKKCTFREYRTWVMINYFLGTGNRVNTVVNLKINDIDWENDYIRLITTKNRKQQIVPLSHSLKEILQEYLKYRGGEPEDYLFCTEDGKQLIRSTVSNSVYDYNKKRGVEITSIHAFRHTYAITSVKNGIDIFKLQKLLGHSDISTTRIYVNLADEDLKVDYDKFNPLDTFLNRNKKEHITMKKKR